LSSCQNTNKESAISEPEFAADIYSQYGFPGSFMIWCPQTDSTYFYNAADTGKGYLPASTFKILNTLISLETGIMKSEKDTQHWDKVVRWVDNWNQDLDLQHAYKYSCVWFYQRLARKIGRQRMNKFLRLCDYGNVDTTGAIDGFWLNGSLRINHRQQIQLLAGIKNETLPFAKSTFQITKRIMIQDSGSNYIIRAKTGWVDDGKTAIGWYVGWLEKEGKTYYFSTRVYADANKTPASFANARIEIANAILKNIAGAF
jgi:beta-lactamase class D